MSQHYELEDKILKEYPKSVLDCEEHIVGYKADMETVKANTPAGEEAFPPMVVHDVTYTEKAEAGKAIIDACKQMVSPDPIPLGQYRGFDMELSFETFAKEYRIALKGALRHTVPLGSDIGGNIIRIDNVLEKFEIKLKHYGMDMEDTVRRLEAAKIEVEKPFPQEDELHQKTERLNELNILLNMDEKDHTLVDGEPDVGDEEPKWDRGIEW